MEKARAELKRRLAGTVRDGEPFQIVRLWLELRAATETINALAPDLADAGRHFNAGRAAEAHDALAEFDAMMET